MNQLKDTTLQIEVSKYGGWIKIIDKAIKKTNFADINRPNLKKPIHKSKVSPRCDQNFTKNDKPVALKLCEDTNSPKFNYSQDNTIRLKKSTYPANVETTFTEENQNVDSTPIFKNELVNVDYENKLMDNLSFGGENVADNNYELNAIQSNDGSSQINSQMIIEHNSMIDGCIDENSNKESNSNFQAIEEKSEVKDQVRMSSVNEIEPKENIDTERQD